MKPRRPVAIALAASAFYAGIFVTNAHAEMHYVRVTLVTGQQLTITVDIPPGTPLDQLQIPGLPAAIASIVDLGSTESTPDADGHRLAHRPADGDRDAHARPERHVHAGLEAGQDRQAQARQAVRRPGHRGQAGGRGGVQHGEG